MIAPGRRSPSGEGRDEGAGQIGQIGQIGRIGQIGWIGWIGWIGGRLAGAHTMERVAIVGLLISRDSPQPLLSRSHIRTM